MLTCTSRTITQLSVTHRPCLYRPALPPPLEPQHCSPDELDDRVVGLLLTLPPQDQIECLGKLDSALRTQRPDIRSVSAFLAGVIKRNPPSGSAGGGSYGGGGGGYGGGGGGWREERAPPERVLPELAPGAAQVLDSLTAQGILRPGDLDGRSLAAVAAMPPDWQAFVLGSFAEKNFGGVRNMAGQGVRWGSGAGLAAPHSALLWLVCLCIWGCVGAGSSKRAGHQCVARHARTQAGQQVGTGSGGVCIGIASRAFKEVLPSLAPDSSAGGQALVWEAFSRAPLTAGCTPLTAGCTTAQQTH